MPRDGPSPRSVARPASTADERDRRAAFARQVRDALSHLYDPISLQTHPLARLVARQPDQRPPGAGTALRQVLLEAIAALHPLTGTSNAPLAGPSYQILQLRYVEGLEVPVIQGRLALGKSEYYREQQHGVDALVSLLWDRWQGTPLPVVTPATDAAPVPPRRRDNLPTPTTTYIPRAGELARVGQRLRETRLVTLTGPGGCGKTRLALEVARVVLEEYADGVWLVELAPLTDPTLVPQAVATVLDVREAPGRSLLATLADHLRDQQALLLVDNCEHLIDAAAHLADALLATCPQLRILATSREVLGLAGEVVWRVPSLSLPGASLPVAAAALAESEAARLFVDRARAALPGFALTDQNAPAVTQICVRLDGIPLALELAAARVRGLTVEQIAARLDDRFRLLTGGSRAGLRRQQTLRAAVDWSHDLLSAPERTVFRRLAVFAGGWTLEAAEAVCGEGDGEWVLGVGPHPVAGLPTGHPLGRTQHPIPTQDVLDLLLQLVDKSLVLVGEGREAARYRFLETIRQYAGERLLEAGEAEEVRTRHRAWYLNLAEQALPELTGPDQKRWLDRLEDEHDNLRAALAWSAANPADAPTLLHLAAVLGRFWRLHNHFREGIEWLALVVARSGATPNVDRARALAWLGHFESNEGNVERARLVLEEGVAQARMAGDRIVLALSLRHLSYAIRSLGDQDGARRRSEEALAVSREVGDKREMAYDLYSLAGAMLREDAPEAIEPLLVEGLALARESGDAHVMCDVLLALSWVSHRRGELTRARTILDECLTLARRADFRGMILEALLWRADLAAAEQDWTGATDRYRQVLRMVIDVHRGHTAYALDRYAAVCAARGEARRAARLLGATSAAPRGGEEPFFLFGGSAVREGQVAAARRELGESTFAAAWAEGQAMSLESAVELALAEGE